MQVIEGHQRLGSIRVVLGVLPAPFDELEGALIAEASGPCAGLRTTWRFGVKGSGKCS